MAAEKEYRLEIDPSILKLLGPNLYTNIYYVLAELIANAYDASAKNVYIINKDDSIIVEDDGKGMSYQNGEVDHYLDVAKETRTTAEDGLTGDKPPRRKMGRKGVGKLSALSVSENVIIKTKANGECSGFVLSRSVPGNKLLQPLEDATITFEKIEDINHGTSIVMTNPEYNMHKTHDAIKKNLLKIFPMVNSDFQIHIITADKETVINSFEKEMVVELGTLELIGEEFKYLKDFYQNPFPDNPDSVNFLLMIPAITESILLTNKNGDQKEYVQEIKGWIGTYKSTAGKKLGDKTDFPDNFISLFANNKLGEFNILPIIGKNRLPEVYIVGQLHIDLFEETELPDMALSNRQGYKTEDKRYQALLKKADVLLTKTLSIRNKYADISKAKRTEILLEAQKKKDEALTNAVVQYKESFKNSLSKNIKKVNDTISDDVIQQVADETSNETIGLLGLKQDADKKRKRILLSQTKADKPLSDIIYEMLLYNNISKEEIIYSNSANIESRIPSRTDVYDYLRDLFVDTYSKEKLYIIYVTSQNMHESWGCHMEAGAGWIIKNEWTIFNSNSYIPEKPIDDGTIWHSSDLEDGRVSMDAGNVEIFIENISHICSILEYTSKSHDENLNHLKRMIDVIEN